MSSVTTFDLSGENTRRIRRFPIYSRTSSLSSYGMKRGANSSRITLCAISMTRAARRKCSRLLELFRLRALIVDGTPHTAIRIPHLTAPSHNSSSWRHHHCDFYFEPSLSAFDWLDGSEYSYCSCSVSLGI